jgi:hypothetical protein
MIDFKAFTGMILLGEVIFEGTPPALLAACSFIKIRRCRIEVQASSVEVIEGFNHCPALAGVIWPKMS